MMLFTEIRYFDISNMHILPHALKNIEVVENTNRYNNGDHKVKISDVIGLYDVEDHQFVVSRNTFDHMALADFFNGVIPVHQEWYKRTEERDDYRLLVIPVATHDHPPHTLHNIVKTAQSKFDFWRTVPVFMTCAFRAYGPVLVLEEV